MALKRLSRAFRRTSDASTSPLVIEQPDYFEGINQTDGVPVNDIPQKLKKTAQRLALVREHSTLAESIKWWKNQLSVYRGILQELSDGHRQLNTKCPCFHHKEYNDLVANTIMKFASARLAAQDYEKPESPIISLLANARRFSKMEHELSGQEIMYREMSLDSLRNEVTAYKKEGKRLRNEADFEVLKLERLSVGIDRLNQFCFLRRYPLLKYLVEEATVDCLVDA